MINSVENIMKRSKHYKVRGLLLMIRKAIKMDRGEVAESLHVNASDIYNVEMGETMRYKIAEPILRAMCRLYGIDYDIINQKMIDEHKAYKAL